MLLTVKCLKLFLGVCALQVADSKSPFKLSLMSELFLRPHQALPPQPRHSLCYLHSWKTQGPFCAGLG